MLAACALATSCSSEGGLTDSAFEADQVRWIACDRPTNCEVWATTDLGEPRTAWQFVGEAPYRGERPDFRMGVVARSGQFAIVSYPEAFRGGRVQVVDLASGDWVPAQGPLTADAPPLEPGPTVFCPKADGCWVRFAHDIALPDLPILGSQECGASMGILVSDSRPEVRRYIVSPPDPVLASRSFFEVQVVDMDGAGWTTALPAPGGACLAAPGATGNSWVAVPAGPAHLVGGGQTCDPVVSAFEIQRREVSQLEYFECMQAGACTLPAIDLDFPHHGEQAWPDPATASLPAMGLSGDMAAAYCAFIGAR